MKRAAARREETDMDVMLELSMRVMEHDAGSPLRVQHTQKVYAFARQIGL